MPCIYILQHMIHVIALSGGKDSTALACRLSAMDDHDYIYICTPTGDELPEMIAHWSMLERLLDKPIIQLTAGTLKDLCDEQNMLPNWRARFCTRMLKIEPCQRWINEQAEPVALYVGLRADEEGREGGIYDNCEVKFPLREWGWGLVDVLDYLHTRGISIPKRTDCARCFFQTLPQWYDLWRDYPDIYADAVAQEQAFGHTFRSDGRDTWPAALDKLSTRFANGDKPRGLSDQESLFGFSANQCRTCSL